MTPKKSILKHNLISRSSTASSFIPTAIRSYNSNSMVPETFRSHGWDFLSEQPVTYPHVFI